MSWLSEYTLQEIEFGRFFREKEETDVDRSLYKQLTFMSLALVSRLDIFDKQKIKVNVKKILVECWPHKMKKLPIK